MRLRTLVLTTTFATAMALSACGDDDPGIAEVGTTPPTDTTSSTAADSAMGASDDDEGDDAAADPGAVSCVAGDGGDTDVAIVGFSFEPGDAAVDPGSAVTFTNEDPADHSIWSEKRIDGEPAFESVGSDPSFRLPEVLHEGDATTCTFPDAGTYAYLCGVHNSMRGTITVG